MSQSYSSFAFSTSWRGYSEDMNQLRCAEHDNRFGVVAFSSGDDWLETSVFGLNPKLFCWYSLNFAGNKTYQTIRTSNPYLEKIKKTHHMTTWCRHKISRRLSHHGPNFSMHPMPFGKVPGLWSIEGMPTAKRKKSPFAEQDSGIALDSSHPWALERDQSTP